MFWLLLCPGTILEPSCHPSCSPPPLSGPLGQRHSTPSAAIRRPLRGSAPQPPRSFTIQVAGQGCAISRLKACTASDAMPGSLRRHVHAQVVLPQPSGSRFQTCWSLHLLLRRCHKTVPGLFSYPARRFCMSGTGGAFTASTDVVLDTKSQDIPEVVVVRRGAGGVLGSWEGRVNWVRGSKWGQFTSNLRGRWTIPVTTGGSQVSGKGHKGETKGNWQGEQEEQGELRHVYM